jgi:hypothetical protein
MRNSVNIAARAEISQYPLDVYIKLQVLKYMARISNKDNNPLLLDAYNSHSKTLHLNEYFFHKIPYTKFLSYT